MLIVLIRCTSHPRTYLINTNLYFWPSSSNFPPINPSANHESDFFFCEFDEVFFLFFFQIPHISDPMPYLSFSWRIILRLMSSNMMPARLIHIVKNDRISLLVKGEQYSIRYVSHFLYLLICHQTLGLCLCLGYCEQCCPEHRRADTSLKQWVRFLGI